MPSPAASQFADSPWPEHASSRVREQLYEQSELAKPSSHLQSEGGPEASQLCASPWPEQVCRQCVLQLAPAQPSSHVHSVPLPIASQFADAPWPEHASARVREQLYEQLGVARPAAHVEQSADA